MNLTKPTYLVIDATNILYRTFYANQKTDESTVTGLAHHAALTTCNKYFRKYNPDKIIMCFDRSNWRKDYTLSDECVSKEVYKGNRRKNMTPAQQKKFEAFKQHIGEFEKILDANTSIITLSGDKLEADDFIAGVVQAFNDVNHVIISSDSDMRQLISDNVSLINPANGKPHDLSEWDDDPKYYLFEKCIRGDKTTDNIASAFPGVRKTKIREAYKDDYALANMMEQKWTNKDQIEFTVKDLFEENRKLIDLTQQPNHIKAAMYNIILDKFDNQGRYNNFDFLRFCGKYDLIKISENISNYIKMLSA